MIYKQITNKLEVSSCGHMLEICLDGSSDGYYGYEMSELLTKDEVLILKEAIDAYIDHENAKINKSGCDTTLED